LKRWISAAALALCAGAAAAQAPTPAADAAQVSAAEQLLTGRRLYVSYCTRCHGVNLVSAGGAFFDLRTFPRDDKDRFMRSMKEGKRAMPAWEGIVKPHEMEALWLYIGSVNGWTEPDKPK
jgi:mono/diheme cytochrome c family protein